MKLADGSIQALKPKEGRYEHWVDKYKSLGIWASPEGTKSWIFMYRRGGELRRMTLGREVAANAPRIRFPCRRGGSPGRRPARPSGR